MNPGILYDPAGFRQFEGETLPIFTRKLEDLTLFYAPGYLAAVRADKAEEISGILTGEYPFGSRVPHYLIRAAGSAVAQWHLQRDPEHYLPTCLTLYSTLGCNLNCSYCFAREERNENVLLSKDHIFSAARSVLKNCREKGEPLTAVFHGGGEPAMDPRLGGILSGLKSLCSDVGIGFRSYIATNGVMDAEKACFIAENFDEIGLSVDGPPEIQDRQRPLKNGGESSEIVERTAGILKAVRGRLSVRATVLPANFRRIPEIVSWCHEKLNADGIHIEPVYRDDTGPEAAEAFCSAYLSAKQDFSPLSFSGSRIREIHGRYCQIFRNVRHLVPPDGFSVCFAVSSKKEAERKALNMPMRYEMYQKLLADDPDCLQCFNRYHCARGCPDICPGTDPGRRDAGSFRCIVSRTLAEAELLDLARGCLMGPARQYSFAGIKLREV